MKKTNRRLTSIIIAAVIVLILVAIYVSGSFLPDSALRADFNQKFLSPSLRHPFGTLAIAAGADISVVARQLGHSDIKTTARYYLRPDLSVLRSLQRAWERLIIGAA